MGSPELEKLERIARNMPILSKIELAAAQSDHGMIYMAWGADAKGVYLGLWGARGFGRTVEFKPEVRNPELVRNALMADAAEVLAGIKEAGMLHKGWWHA